MPRSLDNAVIGEAAPQFVEYRIPVSTSLHPVCPCSPGGGDPVSMLFHFDYMF